MFRSINLCKFKEFFLISLIFQPKRRKSSKKEDSRFSKEVIELSDCIEENEISKLKSKILKLETQNSILKKEVQDLYEYKMRAKNLEEKIDIKNKLVDELKKKSEDSKKDKEIIGLEIKLEILKDVVEKLYKENDDLKENFGLVSKVQGNNLN